MSRSGLASTTSIACHAQLWMVAVFLTLSGCSTGSLFDSDTPVPTSYVLAPAPAAQTPGTPLPVDVSVSRPDLASGLDSDRIAVLEGRKLDYYRGVRWGTRAIEMVQNLVVDSLEDQQLFRSVTPEQARVAGDYVLDLQVRHFQAEYAEGTNRPIIHVALVGRLIRIADRELVATATADARVESQDNRMAAVAASFEAAAHQAILELGQHTVAAVKQDQSALEELASKD